MADDLFDDDNDSMWEDEMFTERELLIMSFAVDKMGDCELMINDQELFFERKEADALCHKIHMMLHAARQEIADYPWK